jgi:hypothetical protein
MTLPDTSSQYSVRVVVRCNPVAPASAADFTGTPGLALGVGVTEFAVVALSVPLAGAEVALFAVESDEALLSVALFDSEFAEHPMATSTRIAWAPRGPHWRDPGEQKTDPIDSSVAPKTSCDPPFSSFGEGGALAKSRAEDCTGNGASTTLRAQGERCCHTAMPRCGAHRTPYESPRSVMSMI